ncbi:hypothetical protein HG536_0B03500 [Torulaspora globosa]|uniref:Major facilitator superfamily (MFS) profile domain-containing protein n=1 Tax=Torulaspora globosa TaxID=48254 RepID=A0A7G3ZDA1_9SACH|nr:uncharacterized protein HG536_0B03500 [Torulaspora globosa]QLL31487.1 hypothetical protein HG536_0B03500 [Torulaspora globosa]
MVKEGSPLLSASDTATRSSRMDDQNGSREIVDEGFEYVAEQTGLAFFESLMTDEPQAGETEEMRWLREVRLRHKHMNWFQRPSLAILCSLVMLVCLGETLCITPMIGLTMKKVCEGIAMHHGESGKSADDVQCDPQEVQSVMSVISSFTMILTGLACTFTSGTWGEFSDRAGRVRIFGYMALVRVIGNSLHFWALLPSTPYHKWLIILAGSVSSLSGGMLALLANANSYISDIVEADHRALSMSIMMSAVYATMGLGPMLGSVLVKNFGGGDRLPIYLSIAIGLLAAILCFTSVREPRHEEALKLSQATFVERRDSISSIRSDTTRISARLATYGRYHLLRLLDVFSSVKTLWLNPTADGSVVPRYTVLMLVALDIFFLSMTAAAMPALVLFATYQYGWRSVELGYFISISGLGRAAVLLVISPCLLHVLRRFYKPLNHSIDRIDVTCIKISLVLLTCSVAAVLVGKEHEAALFTCAVLQALSAFCSPTIQSAIIKYCSKKFTGRCFGAMALIRSSVMLIVPPILLRIYGTTVSFKPELFLYIPLTCGICAIILSNFLHIIDDATAVPK